MEASGTFQGWGSEQIVPVSLLLGFFATGFFIFLLSAWTHRRQLARARVGESMESFVRRMTDFGFDGHLSRLTYIYLTERKGISFPIRPRDLLDEDLGLSEGDVREMVDWVLYAAGRQYALEKGPHPLMTVADVVKVVQASPLLERLAA